MNFRHCRFANMMFVILLFLVLSNSESEAQSQYANYCQQELEQTDANSLERLYASLKLTRALYLCDLEQALAQAEVSSELANRLNHRPAQAASAMEQALIVCLLIGQDESRPYYERAIKLFDESTDPEYRILYYIPAIQYEIACISDKPESVKLKLSEFLRLNDYAASECKDEQLVLRQNMWAVYNRVVKGHLSSNEQEIQRSLKTIRNLNAKFNFYEADALLAYLEAFSEIDLGNKENAIAALESGLQYANLAESPLMQMLGQGRIAAHYFQHDMFEQSIESFKELVKLATQAQIASLDVRKPHMPCFYSISFKKCDRSRKTNTARREHNRLL